MKIVEDFCRDLVLNLTLCEFNAWFVANSTQGYLEY